jgi:hypothetical protein
LAYHGRRLQITIIITAVLPGDEIRTRFARGPVSACSATDRLRIKEAEEPASSREVTSNNWSPAAPALALRILDLPVLSCPVLSCPVLSGRPTLDCQSADNLLVLAVAEGLAWVWLGQAVQPSRDQKQSKLVFVGATLPYRIGPLSIFHDASIGPMQHENAAVA